jgi:hypothetical protein
MESMLDEMMETLTRRATRSAQTMALQRLKEMCLDQTMAVWRPMELNWAPTMAW